MINVFRKLKATLLISAITVIFSPVTMAGDTGFMIGVGAYYAELDDDLHANDLNWGEVDSPGDAKVFFDDKSYGYHLDIGWRFNQWLAVDAGYWDLGEFSSDRLEGIEGKVTLDTTAYTLGGIISLPVWVFDLYGRGGALFWDVDSSSYNNDGTDAYYGVGAALNIFGGFDLYLELLRFEMDTPTNKAGLGIRFTF